MSVDRAKGEFDKGQFEETLDVDYVTGGSMLISREALLNTGLLGKFLLLKYVCHYRSQVILRPAIKGLLNLVLKA